MIERRPSSTQGSSSAASDVYKWQEVDAGSQVAVVVSAMAGVTDRMVEMASAMDAHHDAREYDAVITIGEQAHAGLMAIVFQKDCIAARS